MPPIVRLTLFKIPDRAVVQQAFDQYATLSQRATKDGKAYIQMSAGHIAHEDARSSGYTFVARTVFSSVQDMEYYDAEDAAHGEIKALLKGKVEDGPPLVVYMDG